GGGEGVSRRAGEGLSAGSTVGEVLDETAAALAVAGIDEPRRRARRIMVAALGLSPAEVFAHPQRMLDREEHARIAAIARRAGVWRDGSAGERVGVCATRPYIATAAVAPLTPCVRALDPRGVHDGGAGGLAAYREIARERPRLLVPGGLVAAELGLGQADSVA